MRVIRKIKRNGLNCRETEYLFKNKYQRQRQSEHTNHVIGELKQRTTATAAAKTILKRPTRAVSNFIAIIPISSNLSNVGEFS